MSILKATETAIVENGLPLVAESYARALLPLLDDEKREAALGGNETRIVDFNVAVCYLLSFVFPRLSDDFLREQYRTEGLYATLSHALTRFHLVAPFVRSAIVLVGAVLQAHLAADWRTEQSSLSELFVALLGLAVDARPKVRRLAQDAIVRLLGAEENVVAISAAPGSVAQGLSVEFVASALLNATKKDALTAQHLHYLLRHLLPVPGAVRMDDNVDNLVSGMLHCLSLTNGHLASCIYGVLSDYATRLLTALEKLPLDCPDQLPNQTPHVGPVYGVVRRLQEGLAKQRPRADLADLTPSFLTALASLTLATVQLQVMQSRDASATLRVAVELVLNEYFAVAVEQRVLIAAGNALVSLIGGLDCARSEMHASLLRHVALPLLATTTVLPAKGRDLQDPQQRIRFAALLSVLTATVETHGMMALEVLSPALQRISRLHDARNLGPEDRQGLLHLVKMAIRTGGLECSLQLFPLNLLSPAGEDASSSSASAPQPWLLPLLRDALHNTQLRTLMTAVFPLAERIEARAVAFRDAQKAGEAQLWETLHLQLLSLLPAVLGSFPTDFSACIGELAEPLARLLNDNPRLRPALLAALLRFVRNSEAIRDAAASGALDELHLPRPISGTQAEADLAHLAALLPQLLPLLFNIFAAVPGGNGGADEDGEAGGEDLLLQVIGALLALADGAVVESLFARTLRRVGGAANAPLQCTVLDLAGTMLPHVPLSSLLAADAAPLLDTLLPLLATPLGAAVQKRLYRCLVTAMTREDMRAALVAADAPSALAALETALLGTAAAERLHPAAKRLRFRLLALLAPELSDHALAWIPQLLPEVLLGVKETNARARTQAHELLVAWGRRMSRGGRFSTPTVQGRDASLHEYFTMMLAGLAGHTPHMISATVMALARIVFEFAPVLLAAEGGDANATGSHDNIIVTLTRDICILLQSPSRELVKAAISFIKVSLVVLDSPTLQPLLPIMVDGLLRWATVHHQNFKTQVRHLLVRLMRRFGASVIEKATPAAHLPLIASIRRERERAGRKTRADATLSHETNDREDVSVAGGLSRAALSRLSRRTARLLRPDDDEDASSSRPPLSAHARFERVVQDSSGDEDQGCDDSDDERNDRAGRDERDDDRISSALTRKLSLAPTVRTAVAPSTVNMSRKQQMALRRQQVTQQARPSQSASKTKDRDSEAEAEESDDDCIRFGADGKLHVGSQPQGEDGDMDGVYRAAMSSFKRTVDGKRVKFARGARATAQDDDDGPEDDGPSSRVSSDARSTVTRTTGARTSASRARSVATTVRSMAAHSGLQYQARGHGARGDAKRKGAQHDPYAYVPIKRKTSVRDQAADPYFMKRHKRPRS